MPPARNTGAPGPIFLAAEICRTSLRACLQHDALMRDQWAELRLADFNLWASGIGALAQPKASLDRRLDFRPDARDVILFALRRLRKEADRCAQLAQTYDRDTDTSALSTGGTAACEIDSLLSTTMSEVEAPLEQLLRLSVAIRRSGTQARLVRADQSLKFQSHSELYMLLLAKIVASQTQKASAAEYTHNMPASMTIVQLNDVQRRLIYANLKRRNRFIYAQEHSRALAPYEEAQATRRDRLWTIFGSAKSAIVWVLIKLFVVLLLCIHIASQAPRLIPRSEKRIAVMKSTRTRGRSPGQRLDTTSDFSKLPAAARMKEIPSDAMTQLSTTTRSLEYPRPPAVDPGSKGFMCPCCCETLPVMFAKDTFWKKHLREDLAPYTCVMPDCRCPLTLYSNKEDWKHHLEHDHVQYTYWLCPLCPKSVKQEPGSDVPAVSITQFDDEANFEGHLVSEHPSAEKHIASIKDQSQRSAPMDIDQCPLCSFPGDAKAKVDRLALLDHIANDVHAFSLYSLPWPADDPEEQGAVRVTTDDEIGQWLGNCLSAGHDDHGDVRSDAREDDEILSAGEGGVATEPSTASYLRCISGEISHAIDTGALQIDPTQKRGRFKDNFFQVNAYFSQFENDSNGATVPRSHTQSITAQSATTRSTTTQSTAALYDSSTRLSNDDIYKFIGIPFPRNPDFVERMMLTRQIGARLAVPPGRAALVGMSGVGKTQLAIEYVYGIREQLPQTLVIWFDSASAGPFREVLRGHPDFSEPFYRRLHMEVYLEHFNSWLSDESKGHWLIVLDNANAVDVPRPEGTTLREAELALRLVNHIPYCEHGSVLIITRDKSEAQKVVNDSGIIDVPMMSEQEAEALLVNKLGQASEYASVDAQRLVRMVDYLPLAITQAAAFILECSPRLSIRKYCEGLEQGRPPLSRKLEASLEQVLETHRSAADLLPLLSFCDPDSIPRFWLQVVDSKTFEDDIPVLLGLSLVYATVDSNVFKMRSSVQAAIRAWLEDTGRRESFLESFVHRMYSFFPDNFFALDRTKGRVLLPHAVSLVQHRPVRRDSQLEWASVMHNAALYARHQGDLDNALELATSVLRVRSEQLGEEDELTVRSKENLARIYYEQRRWHQAEELQRGVVRIRKKVLGEEHPDTLYVISELARTYSAQGRFDEAGTLLEEALQATKEKLGSSHRDTLKIVDELVVTYLRQERPAEAGTLLEEALQATKKNLGSSDRDTMKLMDFLASTYSFQGRHAEAETLREERRRLEYRTPDQSDDSDSIQSTEDSIGDRTEESTGDRTQDSS